MVFYLSATGNSRFTARSIASQLGDNRLVDLRRFLRGDSSAPVFDVSPGERIGFVFPVHSWGLPKKLGELIASMRFNGYRKGSGYCYMVCTCGDDTGLTAKQWGKAVQRCGLEGNAAFSVFMPNTYVLLPGFDVDSKETVRRKLAAAPQTISGICRRIEAGETGDFTCRGSFAAIKSRLIYPLFMRAVSDKPFRADPASCTGCGKCAALCPTGNITIGGGTPHWHGDCTNCLACFHGCPAKSIAFGGRTRKKGHYVFPAGERQCASSQFAPEPKSATSGTAAE